MKPLNRELMLTLIGPYGQVNQHLFQKFLDVVARFGDSDTDNYRIGWFRNDKTITGADGKEYPLYNSDYYIDHVPTDSRIIVTTEVNADGV